MIFNKTYVLILFLIFISVISCSKDKTDPPPPCEKDTSFNLEIKAIFLNNCATCHDNNHYTGVALNDYNSIVLNIDESLFYIKNGEMPWDQYNAPASSSDIIDPIDDTLIKKIECWVVNGMKNN
tara:strand:- start:18 stop:389 length:372 start_codon:yes stop_codon:yes gene_type:complete